MASSRGQSLSKELTYQAHKYSCKKCLRILIISYIFIFIGVKTPPLPQEGSISVHPPKFTLGSDTLKPKSTEKLGIHTTKRFSKT